MSKRTPSPSPARDGRDDADVALLCAPTEDRKGVSIVRSRKGRLEAGELREAREGQPLAGELVKLHPRQDRPWLCDVEVLYAPAQGAASASEAAPTGPADQAAAKSGPTQVTTEAYRHNWERIFRSSPALGRRKPPRDGTLN